MTYFLGLLNWEYMLTFNLHTVKPAEEILGAEIHFNLRTGSSKRRYWKNGKKRRADEIRCFAQTPTTNSAVELSKRDSAGDWLSFDAGHVIEKSIFGGQGMDNYLRAESSQPGKKLFAERLMVKFVRIRKNGKRKEISPENAMRRNSPFLLMHTNNPVLVNKEEVRDYSRPSIIGTLIIGTI